MSETAARETAPLYRDIAERTQGEIYIGVVGPVRAGKSTFITGFMNELVLPMIAPGAKKDRIVDELPQSASGRSIMTTQPRFVPSDGAASVQLPDHAAARIRMVDSVGYLIRGAQGAQEGEAARMVATPWSDHDLPFEEAAELGTRRVMTDHATMGILITTDGTVTDLPRASYAPAEEQLVKELKKLGKPFAMVLNSASPESREAKDLRAALSEKYDVPVTLLSAKEMSTQDAQGVLQDVLSSFPLRELRFQVPEWAAALDDGHWLTRHIVEQVRNAGAPAKRMCDAAQAAAAFADSAYIDAPQLRDIAYGEGSVSFALPLREGLFNRVLSEQCGAEIESDGHLLRLMKELVAAKREYDRVSNALREANETGYGLVTPTMADVELYEPEVSKQGGRYAIRMRAKAPAMHLIRSDIETEVSPVLGTQEQTDDFAATLRQSWEQDERQLLETNFFGRTLEDLIKEGLAAKLTRMPPEAQEKVRAALTRILNEGDGGVLCILL
ncbi:MAG: stage IV sporulation protein A [Clostridia bacterium]|nr:stage IV sporulation protein A [Clostridia bacterium]